MSKNIHYLEYLFEEKMHRIYCSKAHKIKGLRNDRVMYTTVSNNIVYGFSEKRQMIVLEIPLIALWIMGIDIII